MKDKLSSLKTERLVLHSFTDSDIDYALSIFYNDEIKKTYMLPDFPSRENAVALFERLERLSMNPARFVYGIYLDEINIGGGLGVKYVENDEPPSTFVIADVIINSIKQSCDALNVEYPTIYLEPGRSIISSSFSILTSSFTKISISS